MEILDKLTEGAERVAREAEKVFEQGKRRVGDYQSERQMDAAARKLGYLEYEAHLGRGSDPAKRTELLAEMTRLEEEQKAREAEAQAAKEAAGPAAAEGAAATGGAAEGSAEAATGMADTAIGPEEVTGITVTEEAERRLQGEDQQGSV